MNNLSKNRKPELEAIDAVKHLLHQAGHVTEDLRGHSDSGEDLLVWWAEGDLRTELCIALQVKGGVSFRSANGYRVRVGSHGESWRNSNIPVLCVVHDPDLKQLFWASATEQLQAHHGPVPLKSIAIPKSSVLDASTLPALVTETTAFFRARSDPRRGRHSDAFRSDQQNYERGLERYGAGDISEAEALFTRVGPPRDGSDAAVEVFAKSIFKVAAIRRDRKLLEGADGAIELNRQAGSLYKQLGSRLDVVEVNLILGVCAEMNGDLSGAIAMYKAVNSSVADEPGTDLIKSRVSSRAAALFTKAGQLKRAEDTIKPALTLAPYLDDKAQFSFAFEKHSLLLLRQGKPDEAWISYEKARGEITKRDTLRTIQSLCVLAEFDEADRRPDDAMNNLATAKALSDEVGYIHQSQYIDTRIARLISRG